MARALGVAAGPLLWLAHLAVVYAATGLACARGSAHIVPPVVAAVTVVATAAALWITLGALARLRQAPPDHKFAPFLTATLAALSVVAIVWDGLPLVLVPACG